MAIVLYETGALAALCITTVHQKGHIIIYCFEMTDHHGNDSLPPYMVANFGHKSIISKDFFIDFNLVINLKGSDILISVNEVIK